MRLLHNPNLHRGPNSSAEFNQRNREIREEINRLYGLLNTNNEAISGNMNTVMREHFFLQNHVHTLTQEVDKLRRLVDENGEEQDANSVWVENFYQTKGVSNGLPERAAELDRTHGILYPAVTNKTSRLSYETDSGVTYLPKGLKVYVKEAKNTERNDQNELVYYDLHTPDIEKAVDKKEDTFWIREVSFPTKDAVTEVFGEIHIKLPTEHVTNLFANNLTLHPYPEGSLTIRDVQYKGLGNQWNRLENYPTHIGVDGGESPQLIQNARKQFFQFNKTEMTELRVFYSQPYSFENRGNSTFAYGFQGIDLGYSLFTEKECEFITKVDITDKKALFQTIDEPVVIPADGTTKTLHNLVSHQLYYDESLEQAFDFNQTILPSLSTVYVKTTIKKEGDTVPVLKEVRIPYTFKEQG